MVADADAAAGGPKKYLWNNNQSVCSVIIHLQLFKVFIYSFLSFLSLKVFPFFLSSYILIYWPCVDEC